VEKNIEGRTEGVNGKAFALTSDGYLHALSLRV